MVDCITDLPLEHQEEFRNLLNGKDTSAKFRSWFGSNLDAMDLYDRLIRNRARTIDVYVRQKLCSS